MDKSILDKGLEELKVLKESVTQIEKLADLKKALSAETKSLTKQITADKNHLKTEIDKVVSERRGDVDNEYDKQLSSLISKKNKIQSKRAKSRKEAVSDRIKTETNKPVIERKNIRKERKIFANQANIPLIARNRLFSALYIPSGFKDILIISGVLILVLLIIPCGIYFLWLSERSYLYLALLYIVTVLVFGGAYLALNKIKTDNLSNLIKLRDFRVDLDKNKKKIKKIEKNILRDPDESRYGLHEFDTDIRDIDREIDTLKSEKAKALETFENITKESIINEIVNMRQPAIDSLSDSLKKKSAKLNATETEYSKLSLELSTNYEVFIGREYMSSDKLSQLEAVMKDKGLQTIKEAISYMKENKSK